MNWQEISTAPTDGTWFIGYRSSRYVGNTIALWKYDGDGFFVDAAEHDFEDFQPTHWMPMPAAPEGSAS